MAAPGGMSAEDEEALRQMMEEPPATDLRSEGDAKFFADGARIELFGLQGAKHLNGQIADVVGFDNDTLRYRVKLCNDGAVKQVTIKNMMTWTPPVENALVPMPAPTNLRVPTREVVVQALAKVARDTTRLQEYNAARQMGVEMQGDNICDVFLRANTSFETHLEIYEIYKKAFGDNEELREEGAKVAEKFDEVVNLYTTIRTWTEMAQDEWNLTNYSIRKHGIVGALKNEFVEVGNDVVDLTKEAGDVVVTASTHVAPLVRSATTSVSGVVQSGSTAVVTATGSIRERGQRSARNMVEDQIVGPVKRAWHLLVTAFFLCFIIPLFGLRTYAPLNSVASNLGLVFSALVICCPPSFARRRSARAGLLVLYPLITVVLPLALHYWLMHPGSPGGWDSRGAAQQFGQLRGWPKLPASPHGSHDES